MNLRRKNSISLVCLIWAIMSCEKEEIAIAPHESGDEMINEIAIGEDYGNQLFFDLSSNTVVSSNLKSEWDIAFESNTEHIIINSAKGMAVHRSNEDFAAITSSNGLEWEWDAHTGNLDTTAVGDWLQDNLVYVVDRGYNHSLAHQGYYKFQLLEVSTYSLKIQFAELSQTTPINSEVVLSQQHLFTYFSFDNGVVNIAPEDDQYDLVFTQYTHLFKDPETPYLVTGVLLNRTHTSAAIINDIPFKEISFEDAVSATYSSNLNSIGYDWKWFDFEAGTYITDPAKVFIVKTKNDIYYKLHFTSFYNSEGLKGYPTIEFQAL